MSEMWNLWDVKPPPVCTVKTESNFTHIKNLNEITWDALKTVRDLNHLDMEAAILSRFLYKHRRIFRHDKGIQNLVKVNQCLKRYLKLNILEVLNTFKQSMPPKLNSISTQVYLPTRQMLKWVLLRVQAFSQIFVRVIELTKAAGAYIYKKLFLGWSLNYSLLVFCITARILVMSKYLVMKSIEWYSSFYGCLPFLQETSDFLPDYKFPSDLKLWLGDVDLIPIKKNTFIGDVFELIDLVKNDEEEKDDDYEDDEVKIMNETFIKTLFKGKFAKTNPDIEEVKEEEMRGVKRPLQTFLACEDLGVPVEGGEENPSKKRRRKRKRVRKKREKK